MILRGKKIWVVIFIMITFSSVFYPLEMNSATQNPTPFFYIDMMLKNYGGSNPSSQIMWMLRDQLPKIGIGVDTFEQTGWAQIAPRTWDYPDASWPDNPVPIFDDGGFDCLFLGWTWGLDFGIEGVLNTQGITHGNNYYQYSNPQLDSLITNYYLSYEPEQRIIFAKEIQKILYDDQPLCSIMYSLSLYTHNENLTGFGDGLLWHSCCQPMENWSITDQTIFRYATPGYFTDFHIHFAKSNSDLQWLHQIYNGLVERQYPDKFWQPRICTSFNTTDGLSYVVSLDPNAKWADGTDFTPEDIIYNYNLLLDPMYAFWGVIAIPYNFDNIVILDQDTIQINFLRPYTFQNRNLALDLIPKHIWEFVPPEDHRQVAENWTQNNPSNIFGLGPYKLSSFNSNTGVIHLEKNPYFNNLIHFDEPKFDDIYFKAYSNKEEALNALINKEVDMVDAQFSPKIDEVTGIADASYSLVDETGTKELGLNMIHPYFGTGESCPIAGPESARHVRKAISHIIPRQIFIEEVMNGLALPGITAFPNNAIGFDNSLQPYEYSIAAAKSEMRAAGFEYPSGTVYRIGLAFPMIVIILSFIGGFYYLIQRKR